jgi:FkbM family methyltransferase
MYSQNSEEKTISDYFKGTQGRFLDLGAFDGKTFSNTLKLVEQGWNGVCVEASPIVFPRLLELHKNNPGVQLVCAAIDPFGPRLITWYDCNGDAISTTEPDHVKRWETNPNVHFIPFHMYTLPLNQLFLKFGYDFDFINIDVESTNLAVFQAMPWASLLKTKVVCVEHDTHAAIMEAQLAPLGFNRLDFNGENLILAR